MKEPRFRATIAGLLSVSLLFTGCRSSGGTVLFSAPEGGTVRIGSGSARTVPFKTRLGIGTYPVEILPREASDSTAVSTSGDPIRGWLVVLASWGSAPAAFEPSALDLSDAASGMEMRLTGKTSAWWTPAFRFKGSLAGVPREDPEVRDWGTQAAKTQAKAPPSTARKVAEGISTAILFVIFVAVVLAIVILEVSNDLNSDE